MAEMSLPAMSSVSSVLAPTLAGAGVGMSAMGYLNAGSAAAAEGKAQAQAASYRAGVLRQQAGQELAVASQRISDTARLTNLELSNAKVAQASGAAAPLATDPTVNTLLQRVAGRGQYSALAQLYTGQERALGLQTQAALEDYTAEQYKRAGEINQRALAAKALGSVLSGGSSLFAKYGGGGVDTKSIPDSAVDVMPTDI